MRHKPAIKRTRCVFMNEASLLSEEIMVREFSINGVDGLDRKTVTSARSRCRPVCVARVQGVFAVAGSRGIAPSDRLIQVIDDFLDPGVDVDGFLLFADHRDAIDASVLLAKVLGLGANCPGLVDRTDR